MSDRETFLIVVHSSSNCFVQSFLRECAWTDLSKLQHGYHKVDVFLLQPEPRYPECEYGTLLCHVLTLGPAGEALNLATRACMSLHSMDPTQRALELQQIRAMLQSEDRDAVKSLTPEQIAQVTRFSGRAAGNPRVAQNLNVNDVPDWEPLPMEPYDNADRETESTD